MGIPEIYRKSPEITLNVDYFDQLLGVGFLKIYLAGGKPTSGNTYYLTTNSSVISDKDNQATASGASFDLDFDMTINRSLKVVAVPGIFVSRFQGTTTANTITFTIKHVDGASVETTLATIVFNQQGSAGNYNKVKMSAYTPTAKTFIKGDKLRVTALQTGTNNDGYFTYDPSGFWTYSSEGIVNTAVNYFLLPVEIIQ